VIPGVSFEEIGGAADGEHPVRSARRVAEMVGADRVREIEIRGKQAV
jgi:hypothetical protein